MTSQDVRAELRGFGWRPLGRREPVVRDLDLAIGAGERILLAGPSGSGKSTVLRGLAGALGEAIPGVLSGELRVEGRIGLLQQNPADALVAEQIGRDVAFGPENVGLPRAEIWARVRECLAAVDLPYGLDRPASALSGGELQRLALAGVLALRPGLLLLDEPTSMLDPVTATSVREAVVDVVARTGASLVVVEHRIGPWLEHVDRVVILGPDGTIDSDVAPGALGPPLRDELAAAGLWVPGVVAPAPLTVATALVAPAADPPMLAARRLVVDLRSRTTRGSVVSPALRGVDLALRPGGVTALTGPSGAGKSTLVASFAGLVEPTSGSVAGTPVPLHRMRSRALALVTGWVPQNPEHGLLSSTVREEVAYTSRLLGTPVDVDALLELFGLAAVAGANPFRLSGGEQRRLALAAALAHRPPVWALDEPTVGQDRHTWAAVAGWLRAGARAGAAVAVSTHDEDLLAFADREVRLRDGTVST